MRFASSAFCAVIAAMLAGPAVAADNIPKQDAPKAQQEMPTVGKEATSGGHATTPEMKQSSPDAQKEMPSVGKERKSGKSDEKDGTSY